MDALDELNKTIGKIVELTGKINNEADAEIWDKAPHIIHARLCKELVELMKQNPKKKQSEIPEVVKILTALEVIEKYIHEQYENINK